MSFHDFLVAHAADDSTVGDLATNLLADTEIDWGPVVDKGDFALLLDRHGVRPTALVALNAAWQGWLALSAEIRGHALSNRASTRRRLRSYV